MTELQKKLFEMQDLEYRDFHSRLMPTVDKERIIGIRTPELRKFAKAYAKTEESKEFLDELPHRFYEENNLHAFLLEGIKDYEEAVRRVEIFLTYVDNWATCDMMSPKVFKKHLPELMKRIKVWIKSDETYKVRFAIGMLMKYYLDEEFDVEYFHLVEAVRSDEYYIKMMVAWYFATALAKQYDEAVRVLQERRLDVWTHNKTIQKAVESYRITAEQKTYLKELKIR